jgi:potassium-dependent mechanosensitive channel
MTRLAALLALVIALAVAGPGRAQETALTPDYAAFQQTASEAERILSSPAIDTVALDAIRAELAIWRNRLLAAETANASTIQRLQGQIDALGPVPASDSGTSEPAEIAERRAALLTQLAEAQVPRVNALEGYNRAVSLIGEIDALMRARQNEALLERWPSPLLPSSWQSLGEASVAVLATIREEVGGQISDPTWRATFRDRALPVAIVLFLGGALVLNGRRWIDGLSGLAQRRKARDLLVFFLSLGQIFLPVVGAALVLGAVAVTGVVGEKLSHLLGAAISLLVMIVAATWLGGRLFPPEGGHAPALDLGAEDRAQARRVTLGIGVVLGVGALLRTMAEFEEVGQGARSVLLLPYFLGLA